MKIGRPSTKNAQERTTSAHIDSNHSFDKSRRKFMLGVATTMFSAMIPRKLLATCNHYCEEELGQINLLMLRDEWMRVFSKKEYLKYFRESITIPEMFKIIESFSHLSAKSIHGTKYDFRNLPVGSMFLNNEKGFGNGTVLSVYDRDGKKRFMLVTARHVLRTYNTEKERSLWVTHPNGLDVAVKEIRKDELENGSLPFSKKHLGDQMSGEVVTMVGTDNDTGVEIHKKYPSIVSPTLSIHALEAMLINVKGETDYSASSKRFITIPPFEATPHDDDTVLAQGMSGSGLLYEPDGAHGVRYGGFLSEVVEVSYESGISYSIGLIVDKRHVWETIEELFRREQKFNFNDVFNGAG